MATQESKKVIVDAAKIICREQIEVALLRASQAEINGSMLANDWSIEVMLHLKGQHQIRKSLDFFSINQRTTSIVLIINGKVAIDVELIPGLPKINMEEIAAVYEFSSKTDMCKQIISLGARLILDYY